MNNTIGPRAGSFYGLRRSDRTAIRFAGRLTQDDDV